VGIIAGAVIGAILELSPWGDFALEYALGFGFGWAYFQAFAMKDMVGGSYILSLKETFIPELLSMNLLMTGMVLTMKFLMARITDASDPLQPEFWFTMAMAMIIGFILAYPVNWWLVVNNLKHGMLTVTEDIHAQDHSGHVDISIQSEHGAHNKKTRPNSITVFGISILTFSFLLAGLRLTGVFF
jgi:hypothetical protein